MAGEVMRMFRTIELPKQMPIVSSILSFIAIRMEVTCPATFACETSQVKPQEVTWTILTTKGMRMRPMNAFGILNLFAVSSIESTTEQNQDLVLGESRNSIPTIVCD